MPSTSIFSASVLAVLALQVSLVSGHIALWHPSMFGYDAANLNQNDAVTPLANMNFADWWFHGFINKPPAAGEFLELPAGGILHSELACNKGQTSYGPAESDKSVPWACEGSGADGGIGPLHTSDAWMSSDPKDLKGCGISIAYTSDEHSVQPEDFTVISVNETCAWWKHTDFEIPSDLPATGDEGAICQWNWIHSPDSGSEQMYSLMYRCKVTGATNTVALSAPKIANRCDYPSDTSNCTVGPKQPHYWLQNERNNNFQGYYDPPYYNHQYYQVGAQTDLFAVAGEFTPAASTSTTHTAASTTTSKAVPTVSSPTTSSSSSTSSSSASSSASSAKASASSSSSSAKATSTGKCSASKRKRSLRHADNVRKVKRNSTDHHMTHQEREALRLADAAAAAQGRKRHLEEGLIKRKRFTNL